MFNNITEILGRIEDIDRQNYLLGTKTTRNRADVDRLIEKEENRLNEWDEYLVQNDGKLQKIYEKIQMCARLYEIQLTLVGRDPTQ